MRHTVHIKLPFLFLATAILSACASAPLSGSAYTEEGLRDSDFDVIFGTEYPVTSKGDALLRADMARQAGDLDKALFFYVKALKFDPKDADLLTAIGLLHQFQGTDELAARAYTLALRIDPYDARVLQARGLILLAHDKVQAASVDLMRAVALNPELWQAHNGLGLLADRGENHNLAIVHYDSAAEINPNSGAIFNNRGYSKLLAGDYAGAEEDLRWAAEMFSHNQAWLNLGTLHARQGRYEQAINAYEQVLSKPEAINKAAETSIANDDYEKAEALLKQAIRISPAYFPAAEENLVQLSMKTGARLTTCENCAPGHSSDPK